MRRQTDANEELTSKIFEILEERDEAHKRFFEQWAEAFSQRTVRIYSPGHARGAEEDRKLEVVYLATSVSPKQ